MRFETKAIHVGEEPLIDRGVRSDVVIPIHLSTTFYRGDLERPISKYEYSRTGNPTREALEKKLAAIEDAKYGLAFSSGMSAESIILITLLNSGDHVVAFDDLYSGTKRLFKIFEKHFGIDFSYADARDPSNVKEAIRGNTRLIWLETPTNPLMKLCDIKAISEVAHDEDIRVVVDNTFMSPYFQKPLSLGADIVVYSTTKYLNGHSDSIGGAITLSDEELYNELKFNQNAIGAILSPFDSYMTLRGIKTLAIRMRTHEYNAMRIARYLEDHPKVERVYYPGLKSHPQHELAKRQMTGFGGMVSFEIAGGYEAAKRFLNRLRIFKLAESLGGVESLIEHPAVMTHTSIPKDERIKLGITDSLIRVSVGIENIDDLLSDLDEAFAAVE